jgi:hypothetical protein
MSVQNGSFFTKISSKNIRNSSNEFNNPFKYKCETFENYMHPFQKIMVNVECNS